MITVDKSEYINTHGRNPKGFGLWMFDVTVTDSNRQQHTTRVERTGKYRDAVASVKADTRSKMGAAATIKVLG